MKTILKLIFGLLLGIASGLFVGAMGVVLFTDTTFAEFIDKLLSTSVSEGVLAALVGMLSFVVSVVILIPIHEVGHLVCGLLTGYKFVSFRIFNLTFIKSDGKIRIKKFSIAGTGGQCLLTPPDLPLEKIPVALYNAGGLFANLIMLTAILPVFFLDLHPLVVELLVVFSITDLFLILMNGIPMKLGGLSNDGYNILYMGRDLLSKRAVVLQLRANALIQEGVRPKEMPSEWFEWRTDVNYKNPLEVSIPLMHASRLIDEMRWEEAYREFSRLYSHKADIMQLYVNEIACELAFCAMVTGREDEAVMLLDSKLRKYIETYRKVMSSKQRILCAIAIYLDKDSDSGEKIYMALDSNKENYLLQGEVKSDLAIMNWLLKAL